jgi:hypothetical protein
MVVAAMAKRGSVWGQIARGRPLFVGEFNVLIAKVDSRKIPTQIESKS